MPNSLVSVAVLIALASPVEATEVWTCTYAPPSRAMVANHTDSEHVSFKVSPPDLIDTAKDEHYRIMQNNDYGLVATT